VSLRLIKKHECEEMCKKRILLEKILDVKEISYKKCVRFCKAFAAE